MNSKGIVISVFLLFFLKLVAQSHTYVIHPNHTKELIANTLDYSPNVYKVYKVLIKKNLEKKIKQKTLEYETLEKSIIALENDSILLLKNYQNAVIKHQQAHRIRTYINRFINSSKTFDIKVKKLQAAQEIANQHHIDVLVYADEHITPNKTNDFITLTKNPDILHTHLKTVLSDLERDYKKPSVSFASITSKRNQLKKKISQTNQYEYITKTSSGYVEQLILGEETESTLLSGTFERGIRYRVLEKGYRSFSKNELIEEANMIIYEIPNEILKPLKKMVLITDTETKEHYLIEQSFLDELTNDFNKSLITQTQQNISPIPPVDSYSVENTSYLIQEYEMMILKCELLTQKLKKHNEAIQNGVMSPEQIKIWEKDLIEARILNNRIRKYSDLYEKKKYPVQQYVNEEAIKNYINFGKILKYSMENIADF